MDIKNIKSLSDYILENYKNNLSRKNVSESINNRDINKAVSIISSFLKKRNVYTLPVVEELRSDNSVIYTVLSYTNNNKGCMFCWERSNTTSLSRIMFTDDFDDCYGSICVGDPCKWKISVDLKGASITRVIQLVADVMNDKIKMDDRSVYNAIKDAQIWESEENEEEVLVESSNDTIIDTLEKKKTACYMKLRSWKKKGNHSEDEIRALEAELEDLKNQLIEARVSVKKNVTVEPVLNKEVQKIENRFKEEERALPEERFSDMESYILNVILGLDTCALICGAPGVGKTYRIMQAIKKEGKVRGEDYDVIKGKCTPMTLYTMLHDYQKRGQILVVDDADAVITDDTSIQLIKAATDSSDERIVAYASSALPKVPEEKLGLYDDFEQDIKGNWVYPKNFVYEGSVIIITNMNAGQIDTAIRSRALICDLNFTTEEILNLVENLVPHIMPEVLTPESKEKALEYLRQLADEGAPMEISIRSFTMISKLMMSDAPMSAIQRRIREQMKLKFLRGGKKY